MGARADDSPAEAGTTRARGTTWVVSQHLLVAQAASAALASVGVPVQATPWEAMLWDHGQCGIDPVVGGDVLVVLDDLEGPAAIDEINSLAGAADARVVVVTSHPPDLWWGGLVDADVVEVVSMAVSVQELAETVARFVAGETLMEPDQRSALRIEWAEAVQRRRRLVVLLGTLSPKEQRVLELLASGFRVAEISQMMALSDSTVRSHVKSLRGKLGAHTQLAAVAMLIKLRECGMAIPPVPRPRDGPAQLHRTSRRR